MSEQEKIKLIEDLVGHYKKTRELFDGLEEYVSLVETKVWDTYWLMFDSYLETVAKIIGDDFGSISWFIWENDCGARKFEVITEHGVKTNICSIEDLVKYLLA